MHAQQDFDTIYSEFFFSLHFSCVRKNLCYKGSLYRELLQMNPLSRAEQSASGLPINNALRQPQIQNKKLENGKVKTSQVKVHMDTVSSKGIKL